MSITIDDKAFDFFKIYEELTHSYAKEINGYRTLVKAIEVMIDQKEKDLQDMKDRAIDLMKQSIVPPETASLQEDQHTDVATEHLPPDVVSSPPVTEKKTSSSPIKRAAGKGEGKITTRSKSPAAEKKATKPKSSHSKKTEKPAGSEKEIKCLYHPESPAVDIGKQLCSSCKWKLRANGLMEYNKNPSVISFLKGETKSIPIVGQPMCPVHPSIPAYNKKTGLCARCQSKAIGIGVTDRKLTQSELDILRELSL